MELTKSILIQQGNACPIMIWRPLLTSVLVNPSLEIIHGKLQQDHLLSCRSSLSIHINVSLLGFCLKCTYFIFQGKHCKHVQRVAMGSTESPLVANSSWRTLKPEPSSLPLVPPGSGLDMWMILLSSTRQNTSNTAHYGGPWWTRIPPLPVHISFHKEQWLTSHYCLWETHTYGPISTLRWST